MKRSISMLAAAIVAIVPAIALAQTQGSTVTRSEVRTQLLNAEQNGTLHGSKVHYPLDQSMMTQDDTAYGGSMNGSSEIGTAPGAHTMTTPQLASPIQHH